MTDDYAARERAVIQQLAWQTLADAKATDDDKRAARRRLEEPQKLDYAALTDDELDALLAIQRKLMGHAEPGLDDPGMLTRLTDAQLEAAIARIEAALAAADATIRAAGA